MYEMKVTVNHKDGIHARPASLFVKEAVRFESEILLHSGETTINGKSIMGLLMLALSPGSKVKIQANGPDEKKAVDCLSKLLEATD